VFQVLTLLGEALLLVAVSAGWGITALRVCGAPSSPSPEVGRPSLFEAGVVGLAVLFAIGAVLSLTVGIDRIASEVVLVVGLGLAAVALGRRWWSWSDLRGNVVVGLPLAGLLVLGALRTPLNGDSGLYHLQYIEWLRDGPLPLGLVNIHHRFGFNSSWLTIVALLGGSRALPDATYLLNVSATVLTLGAMLAQARSRWLAGRRDFATRLSFTVPVVLLLAADETLFSWFGLSPSNDVPAALMSLFAVTCLATLVVESSRSERDLRLPVAWRVAVCMVAAALAVTVKLLQVAVAIAVALWAVGASERRRAIWSSAGRAVLPAAAVVGLWALQNLALSGCLVYPVAGTCLSQAPWAATAESAAGIAHEVKAWARTPGDEFLAAAERSDWPRLWRKRMLRHRKFALSLIRAAAVLAVAAILARLVFRRRRLPTADRAGFVWASGVALSGLGIGFAVAPDPRFVLGFLVLLPAALLAICPPPPNDRPVRAWSRVAAGTTLLVPLLLLGSRSVPLRGESPRWRSLPKPRLETKTTAGGVELWAPLQGDQCWLAPKPCTPEFDDGLEQRRIAGRPAFVKRTSASP
jgi:hypothetical protein